VSAPRSLCANRIFHLFVPNGTLFLSTGIGGAGKAGTSDIGIGDLDYYTGDEAIAHSKSYQLNYPIRQGLIENWTSMEKLWQRCFYDYLRVEPEDHYVLLVSAYEEA
jgi:actin-related protein 3